jgi:hypothetical protein
MIIDYYKWIGLPHKFAADPDGGEGADCLVIAHKVLLAHSFTCPPLSSEWIDLAASQRWGELEKEWHRYMIRVDKPVNCDLSMTRSDVTGFAIGVVIDNGILFVSHRKGVAWIPLSLAKTDFWRIRSAAF